MVTRCRGTRKDGSPCGALFGLSADGFCLTHDPARAEEYAERQKKAAERAGRPRRGGGRPPPKSYVPKDDLPGALESIEDCKRWLSWIARRTATGELDSGAAREANKAVVNLRILLEREGGTEKRLKELERRIREGARP